MGEEKIDRGKERTEDRRRLADLEHKDEAMAQLLSVLFVASVNDRWNRLDLPINQLSTANDESDDAESIKQAVSALNNLSEVFASRRMDASIRSVMAGHNINEFSE